MNVISESDALVKLTGQKTCNDCVWVPLKTQSYAMIASAGLVDADGVRVGLQVELIYQAHPLIGSTIYKFSIFSQNPWGLERVYQLDVRQYKKAIKNVHQLPHEHVGDRRVNGSDTWQSWGYDEVVKYFCRQTNITFLPNVPALTLFL